MYSSVKLQYVAVKCFKLSVIQTPITAPMRAITWDEAYPS